MLPITPASALAFSLIAIGAIIAVTGLVLATINLAAYDNPFDRNIIGYSNIGALLIAAAGTGIIAWEHRRNS